MYDVLIIGAGPAGLTAGIYAARGGMKAGIFELAMPGGQAAATERIENYPGFPDGIGGYELMNLFHRQAEHFGAEFIFEEVTEMELTGEIKTLTTPSGSYSAKSVIIAAGSKPRFLDVPGEKEFHGRGVSYCATCDGAFFKEKEVVVVGGGNSALEEALFLTKFVKKVTIVHRRDTFRATQIIIDRVKNEPKISFIYNATVEKIAGEEKVENLTIKYLHDEQTEIIPADGVFIYIGTQPNTQFVGGKLAVDERGYIKTDSLMQTNLPGVYAAGDIRVTPLRQVSTAVGDGALAAVAVEKHLSHVHIN